MLSGRMALVTKVSSVVHLVDANAKRANTMEGAIAEVAPETYYKSGGEKLYQLVPLRKFRGMSIWRVGKNLFEI